MKLTIKQTIALDYLEDDITTEVLYGGAAGGGKTALGCYWQLKRRLKYPGTRGLLGRAVLKTLKETTLATFIEIAKRQSLKRGNHFEVTSSQDKVHPNCIMMWNGSLIYLKDLYAYPQDPEFDELGSLEITDAFLDECGQISVKAKNVVKSRMRFGLNEHNLKGKMLASCNPNKAWPYADFYKPWKDGALRGDRKFVQALPKDNPNLPASYIETLRGLDKNSRERLLEGNWEYSDDPAILIQYEKIIDCFSNDFESLKGQQKITIDVARLGSDKIVIGIWDGWRVKFQVYEKKRITESYEYVKEIKNRLGIGASDIIADEDGVGGGLVDMIGCHGFVNNSSALPNPISQEDENYRNLKSQCYFRLAERINKGGLYIECEDEELRDTIIEELEQIKQWNMDKDGKKEVMPKDKIKEALGRSPDFADTLMMREWFELSPERRIIAF